MSLSFTLDRKIIGELPFDLEIIKNHCRIDADFPGDDSLLELYAEALVDRGEALTNRRWRLSEYTMKIENPAKDEYEIPITPCNQIIAVEVVRGGTSEIVLDYAFRPSANIPDGGRAYATISGSFIGADSLLIKFIAGWDKDSIPKAFVYWVSLRAASMYEQRETIASATRKIAIELPRTFGDGLLDNWYIPVWGSKEATWR